MKTLTTLLLALIISVFAQSQNEPELVAEFDGAFTINLINVDHGLPKIFVREYQSSPEFEIYNMDFSLYASVSIPLSNDSIQSYYIFYVTRSLFDCDSTQLEYLVSGYTMSGSGFTKIFREDGTTYFSLFDHSLKGVGIYTQDETISLIISNAEGSFMVLSSPTATFAETSRLYKLCGQVPQSLARNSQGELLTSGMIVESGETDGLNIWPNPGKDEIRLGYDLDGARTGTVSIFSQSGQMMKEIKIGRAFSSILIDISDLAQGTYIARIMDDKGFQLSEKFMKVE